MRFFAIAVMVAVAMAACGDNVASNGAPEIAAQQVTTPEDTPVTFTVRATDPDGASWR